MKNVNVLYKKCYDAYKNDCDTDGELNEVKRKNLTTVSIRG